MQKNLAAKRKFEKALKKCFNPKELSLIAKELNIPANIADSIFLYQISGTKKVDRMPPMFIVDADRGCPKILLSANATRDDLDSFVKKIDASSLPSLPRGKKIKPYKYKHIDGMDYVAIDIYKGMLSKIRNLMPYIDKIQAKLPGYSWKYKRSKKMFARDLETKTKKKEEATYFDISTKVF